MHLSKHFFLKHLTDDISNMIATNGSADHSDIAQKPENVARICSQLRDLATEMATLRRQKSSNHDDVMDVDLEYEVTKMHGDKHHSQRIG